MFRSQIQSLSHVAALGVTSATVTGQGDAVRLDGAQVSPDTFAMLGVQPLLGRPFEGRDEPGGADPVLILGHGLWLRRFGADPDIIGRIVTLEGVDRAVVGVMPPRFAFPDAQTQFWIPLVLSPAEYAEEPATAPGPWATAWCRRHRERPATIAIQMRRAEVDGILHPGSDGRRCRTGMSTSYAVSNARSMATEMRFQLRASASN